jgi:MFS transporter, PPP family, 3-phenylpropionic acid transporter
MLSRGRLRLGPATPGALFYFSFFGASATYAPFLSVFFAHRGLSGSEIGLLAAIGPLMTILVAPWLSALADRHNRRVVLLCVALAGTALSLLAVPLSTSFTGLLFVVAVLAVVGSPAVPVADGLIARMAARRGLAYGKMRLWGSLSWAVLAAISGALWQQWGFFWMFPFASLLFLLTIPLARLLEEDRPAESQPRPRLRVVMGDIRLRTVLVATFTLGLAMAVGATFVPVHIDRLGGGRLLVGLFAGITAISELPMMHRSEAIMRRLGGPWTLMLAYALFAGSYLGLVWINSPVLLLGLAVVQGLGFGLFMPITVRMVADWSPDEWSATSQGVLSAGLWGLAPLISGPLAGALYDAAGPGAVFLACAGAAVLAGLVLVMAQLAGVFKESTGAGDQRPVARDRRLPGVPDA